MSDFRTEVTIPVTRDARTFEQRRKDMLTNLERRTSNRRSERTNVVHGGSSDTTASTITSDTNLGAPHFRHRDDWDEEVDQWISESRRRWNEEMRQMRQDMFALEPVDDFELGHWRDMGGIRPIERQDDHSSMMAKMERQMESLRHKMDTMSPLSSSNRIGGPGGSTYQTSSSRITTSSTKSTSGDPRTAKSESNVKESIQQSRTINGVTTGTSSQSSMSTTTSGGDVHKLVEKNTPGALIPHGNTGADMMGFLKNAYELDEDGQVHFKVRFDAKDFDPEDIDVTTVENRLTVNAKKNIKAGQSETTKEFSRTIDLPQSIDHEHFRCNLTEDGVLILDAPVKSPDYDAITFDKGHQLSIRPKSETVLKSTTSSTARSSTLAPMGITGPTILKDGTHGRKLHLEVQVDGDYSADDLCVRTDANSIVVSGKQKSSGGATVREFTRTYEIPETVDPFTVTAQLIGSTLVIEAPLLCTV